MIPCGPRTVEQRRSGGTTRDVAGRDRDRASQHGCSRERHDGRLPGEAPGRGALCGDRRLHGDLRRSTPTFETSSSALRARAMSRWRPTTSTARPPVSSSPTTTRGWRKGMKSPGPAEGGSEIISDARATAAGHLARSRSDVRGDDDWLHGLLHRGARHLPDGLRDRREGLRRLVLRWWHCGTAGSGRWAVHGVADPRDQRPDALPLWGTGFDDSQSEQVESRSRRGSKRPGTRYEVVVYDVGGPRLPLRSARLLP